MYDIVAAPLHGSHPESTVSCSHHLQRNARLEEARAKQTGPVDPATGRTLYQPEMGRGPRSFSRNHEGIPIGEYLHTAAQELASRRQATADAELRTADEAANGGRACGECHRERHRRVMCGRLSEG